jgi:6-pyruvoyltetrahydropterin/6-carboxytetrahydropterin synthase
MYEVTASLTFEAAHYLRKYNGEADEPLHGHTWKVEVGVSSDELDKQGFVIDFVYLEMLLKKHVHDKFDHTVIDEVPPFTESNPTAEHIAKYIYDTLKQELPPSLALWVRVWETEQCSALYK